jgi:hypothetical protein
MGNREIINVELDNLQSREIMKSRHFEISGHVARIGRLEMYTKFFFLSKFLI